MGFAEAVKTCLTKYVTVSGRASRSEFWWFFLFYNLAAMSTMLLVIFTLDENGENGMAFPFIAAVLAFFLPMVAVMARRLHDKGITAWAILLVVVPFGSIALLILCALSGDEQENGYGPPPATSDETITYAASNIPNVRDDD